MGVGAHPISALRRSRVAGAPAVLGRASALVILAAYVAVVFLGVTVGIGRALGTETSTTLSIAATTIVAITFARAKDVAESFGRRLVYGERSTPYETLVELADGMAGAYATEDVLTVVARIVAEGTGAAGARVWLRLGDDLLPAATWPPAATLLLAPQPLSGTEPDVLPALPHAHHTLPVRHGTSIIGALTVTQRPGEPLSPVDLRLLEDIAAEAGLVLRNVRLTAELAASVDAQSAQADELRASRQRIVAAQDEERRRLERNIHDGAQQHLVALLLQLRVARTLVDRDEKRAAASISHLGGVVAEARRTITELAQGLHPPVLAECGLADALRRQTANLGLDVTVEEAAVGRYSPEAEAAVYFACLEALQNASKHAAGAAVVIRLQASADELTFTVEDDGQGFDPSMTPSGSGLANMRDRLSALGGSLLLSSQRGRGTCVTGRLPTRLPVSP